MRLNDNKKLGFTIAEVMVVILILTIIFAAFAPLITSKKRSTAANKGSIWSWHGSGFTAGPMDAYFDAGDPSYSGTAVIGITPESKADITSGMKPLSKIIIRSGGVTSSKKIQRQIQFRYGDGVRDRGEFAGTWFVDGKNMLLGGEYRLGNVEATKITAKNNAAIGYEALNALTSGKYNTALGSYALNQNTTGESNTALGAYAGRGITTSKYNTFVGYSAGLNSSSSFNTAIGYKAGMWANSQNNTYIGANSGPQSSSSGKYNVGVGYNALNSISSGENNTALGAYALKSLTTGSYNTAIGYNACGEVTTGSNKTCIGYNSGPHSGSTADNYFAYRSKNSEGARADNIERTYVGSKPYYYGGDAVLEIHNVGGTNPTLINAPDIKSNTTTVINGNLIVKGKLFFTIGNRLIAWQHDDVKGSGSTYTLGDYKGGHVCANSQTTYSNWGNNCPTLYSDRRMKNIGSKSTVGLNEINKLQVYNYTYKNDKNKLPHVGVMAQDLIKVFPTAVSKDAKGYYQIRWDEMFYASINAIKQLDKKIIALIDRTTKVEKQIAQLEKENTTLKTQVSNLSARVEKLKKQ